MKYEVNLAAKQCSYFVECTVINTFDRALVVPELHRTKKCFVVLNVLRSRGLDLTIRPPPSGVPTNTLYPFIVPS
jgi:hypothetical protein